MGNKTADPRERRKDSLVGSSSSKKRKYCESYDRVASISISKSHLYIILLFLSLYPNIELLPMAKALKLTACVLVSLPAIPYYLLVD
jgi:hypothetical protein